MNSIQNQKPRQKIIIILILNKSFLYDLSTKLIQRISGWKKNPMLIKRAIISFLDIDNALMTKSKWFYSEKFLRFSHEEKI